jgi:hypothetical protein
VRKAKQLALMTAAFRLFMATLPADLTRCLNLVSVTTEIL